VYSSKPTNSKSKSKKGIWRTGQAKNDNNFISSKENMRANCKPWRWGFKCRSKNGRDRECVRRIYCARNTKTSSKRQNSNKTRSWSTLTRELSSISYTKNPRLECSASPSSDLLHTDIVNFKDIFDHLLSKSNFLSRRPFYHLIFSFSVL